MLLGFNLNDDAVTVAIYFITLAFVVGSFFGLRWLLALRFGKLLRASRDGSNRMRFLGYDPAPYKVVAFTIAAVMTGVSVAIFTLHTAVVSPPLVALSPSLDMVLWPATRGRPYPLV